MSKYIITLHYHHPVWRGGKHWINGEPVEYNRKDFTDEQWKHLNADKRFTVIPKDDEPRTGISSKAAEKPVQELAPDLDITPDGEEDEGGEDPKDDGEDEGENRIGFTKEDLEGRKYNELKRLCALKNIPATGTKEDLISRLLKV